MYQKLPAAFLRKRPACAPSVMIHIICPTRRVLSHLPAGRKWLSRHEGGRRRGWSLRLKFGERPGQGGLVYQFHLYILELSELRTLTGENTHWLRGPPWDGRLFGLSSHLTRGTFECPTGIQPINHGVENFRQAGVLKRS
jgi:hypothetical protein